MKIMFSREHYYIWECPINHLNLDLNVSREYEIDCKGKRALLNMHTFFNLPFLKADVIADSLYVLFLLHQFLIVSTVLLLKLYSVTLIDKLR